MRHAFQSVLLREESGWALAVRRIALLSALALPLSSPAALLTESFDSISGQLSGQNGWTASPVTAAFMQSSVARSGNACAMTNASGSVATLTHPISDASATNVVWSDWWAQPVANPLSGALWVPTNATTMFYVQSGTGYLVAYDGTNAMTLSTKPTVTTGTWTRLTVKADYQTKTWSLWMNATNMALGLRFYSTNATRVASFNLDEGNTNAAASYLDDVAVATNVPSGVADQPLSLSITNAVQLMEGAAGTTSTASFVVSLTYPIWVPVSFTYATSNGTAVAPSDYTAISPTTVTLSPGQASTNLSVKVIGNNLGEPDKTFHVNLSNSGVVAISNGTATATILNDDSVPAVNAGGGASGLTTTSGVGMVTVTSTGGVPSQVWLYWGTEDGETNKPGMGSPTWGNAMLLGAASALGDMTGALTNLAAQTTYYYRGLVSNAYLQVWSETRSFVTGPWVLPFVEPFETLAAGNLQGQRGWSVTPNRMAVVQGTAYQGTKAAALTNAATLTHGFTDASATNVVWSDWWAQPVANPLSGAMWVPTNATTMFYVQSGTGYLVAYDGTNAMTLSTKPAVTPGAWTRFTVKADYQTKIWSLWMNTTNMALGLRFYNTNATRVASFNLDEGNTNTVGSYLDDVAVATNVPAGVADQSLSLSITNAVQLMEGTAGTTSSASFVVSLTYPVGVPVSFTYATSNGTAAAPADYTAIGPTTVTLSPGQVSTNLSVKVIGNTIGEPDKTFYVNLGNSGAVAISNGTATATILNDDPVPAVNAGGGAASLTTTSGVGMVTVTSTGGAPSQVWLYWGTVNGETNKPGMGSPAWSYGTLLGTAVLGDMTGALTGLVGQTTYYYRGYVSNAYLQVWTETRSFTTGPWTLPFSEPFETLVPGNIQGQRGWSVVSNRMAAVQGTTVHQGTQACVVTNAGGGQVTTLTHPFSDSSATNVVWTDWWAQPVANPLSGVMWMPTNATAAFYVQSGTGFLVAYNGTNATTLSSKPAATTGTWTRFTVKADYGARRWSLWMNTTNMAVDLSFYNTNAGRLASFNVDEGNANGVGAYVDDVGIETNRPAGITDKPVASNAGGAAGVTNHSATLNGSVVDAGGGPTDVYVYYGTNDGGIVKSGAGGWMTGASAGTGLGAGSVSKAVSNLVASQAYWYRLLASNAVGEAWASPSVGFTTTVAQAWITNGVTVTRLGAGSTNHAVFAVWLSGVSATGVSVRVDTANDTALAGEDYVAVSGLTLAVPAGQTSTTLAVRVLGGTVAKPTRTFTVNLGSATNLVVAGVQGVGTILDTNAWPAVNAGGGAASLTTTSGVGMVTVTSTGGAPSQIWLYWGTVDGTTNKPGMGSPAWSQALLLGAASALGDMTGALTNLAAQTTYYYRGLVSNAYLQVWSETRSFATGPWVLPFAEPFETLAAGNLQGQRGWSVTPNRMAVVQGTAYQGTKAAALTNAVTLTHGFTDATATNVVWTDWWAQPVANPLSGALWMPTNVTAAFYVQAGTGYLVAYDGTNAMVCSNHPPVSAGVWTHFAIQADYAAKTWELWLGSGRVAGNLRFYNTNVTRFASFNAYEGSSNPPGSYVDDITIGMSRPNSLGTGSVYRMR